MDGDGEAEFGWRDVGDVVPRFQAVGGMEDAVVMLGPENIGSGGALDNAVDVLDAGLEFEVGGHVVGVHAVGLAGAGLAVIFRKPNAAAGDAGSDAVGMPRIDADGMNAGIIGAAAKPLLTAGMVPKGFDQAPGIAAIFGTKEAARYRAAPKRFRRRFEGPDFHELPGNDFAAAILILGPFRLRRIGGHGDFLPSVAAVARVVKFRAEMAVIEGGEQGSRCSVGVSERDVIGQKRRLLNRPAAGGEFQRKQAFAHVDT